MLASFLSSSTGRVLQTYGNIAKAQLPKVARWGIPGVIGGECSLQKFTVIFFLPYQISDYHYNDRTLLEFHVF